MRITKSSPQWSICRMSARRVPLKILGHSKIRFLPGLVSRVAVTFAIRCERSRLLNALTSLITFLITVIVLLPALPFVQKIQSVFRVFKIEIVSYLGILRHSWCTKHN